jgi:hypothetical protein
MLPINGRVAIVDDKFEQVKYLINDLSKHQIPYRYYDGSLDSLPEQGEGNNDFRILFMDINLINDGILEDKIIISSLNGVLKRLIPESNYPYVLVYWSRHEHDHKQLIETTLFETEELKNKKPIAFINAEKNKYIEMDGTPKEGVTIDIYEDIKKKLEAFPAYQSLLQWENLVHLAADKTIQELFKFNGTSGDEWSKASLDLLTRFAKASLGNKHIQTSTSEAQIKSSLSVLNDLFKDTLENEISKNEFLENDLNQVEVTSYIDNKLVNSKLLIDSNNIRNLLPKLLGSAVKRSDNSNLEHFVNSILSHQSIHSECEKEDPKWAEKSKGAKQKAISEKRNYIRQDAFLVTTCVDPMCDFVQSKVENSRFVDGVMLQSLAIDFIDSRSEANFISPIFKYENKDYFLVLNYKYLSTIGRDAEQDRKSFSPIFRIRQQMLAEIQSKLARHINRQGILSI